MPEQFRALIVVVVLAAAVFLLARRPACELAMSDRDFVRRRNLWFAVTAIAFLAHNFWLFLALSGVIVLIAGRKEPNVMALYLILLFAVPPFSAQVSGLGLVNQLLSINYPRMLAIALLAPAAFQLRRASSGQPRGLFLTDLLVAGYVLVQLGLQLTVDSFTNTARFGVYAILDVGLPYYVASRALRNEKMFREALMCFAIASMVMASIAMFESVRHWLLYSSLERILDAHWGLGNYLGRNALLRAQATAGQPIALAYVLAIALVIHVYLRRFVRSPAMWWLGLAVILGGLIATLSRGPWMGAVAALLVYRLFGPKATGGLLKAAIIAAVLGAVVLVSPLGATVIEYLPFVGSIETENITYRQELLEISTRLILQNPWFGSFQFLAASSFDALRQDAAGFVDLVNTYVGIGLTYGFVGLTLFVGSFAASCVGIVMAIRRLSVALVDERALGQALIASLACIMVIIFTVSSISFIPTVYWVVIGMGVGYHAMQRQREGQRVDSQGRPAAAGSGLRGPLGARVV